MSKNVNTIFNTKRTKYLK